VKDHVESRLGGSASGVCRSNTSSSGMDEQELKTRLYRQRRDASIVTQVSSPTGEDPPPARCHDNVNEYVARHPTCKAVHGWLIGNHVSFLYFNAHSVVETEDGSLIDITPSEPPCPFLRHPGTNEEFAAIIAETPRLMYQLPPERAA